jgi:hypothetical protein
MVKAALGFCFRYGLAQMGRNKASAFALRPVPKWAAFTPWIREFGLISSLVVIPEPIFGYKLQYLDSMY